MRPKAILLLILLTGQLIYAQNIYPVLNIRVTKNQLPLRQPWSGGLNSPQLTQGDIDGDGWPDLFAFDRGGDKSLVFINNRTHSDTSFDYKPQYDNTIPELQSNAQIRDYNYDSIPDIFTYTPTGTKLYKGRKNGNTISWDIVSPLLLYQDNLTYSNMFSLPDDFSPFVDVNNDGDLDFLTFGLGSSVQYFENQTIEFGLPYDSIRFASPINCWGHFMEDAAVSSIHLVSCKTDESSADSEEDPSRHAGGSSIFAFDNGYDNDKDLIIGDFGWEALTYLENCGSNLNADMCSIDSIFPSCDISNDGIIFPTAFGVDADNDNLMDILVAPNPRAGTSDVRNINYYKNTGDTSCPYQFISDTFLVNQMLDFGTDSKPALFDYNSDGNIDIVVGNYGYFRPFQTYLSELALLENTGTNTEPKFNLRELNYSNLSQYLYVAIHPAFGDLDGDGFKDLLVGELNGVLHFFKNPGTNIVSFNNLTAGQFMGIDVGQYSAPFIYDINNDGLNDLLCGRKDGKISYFWNYGTSTNPQFSMDSSNSSFGAINVTASGSPEGYSQPSIIRDTSGNNFLYVGSNRGMVFKYQIDPTKLRSGAFNLLSNNVLQFDLGTKASVAIGDLNNDEKKDYIAGNSRGGLMYFSEALLDSSVLLSVKDDIKEQENWDFKVFPNPASSKITIALTQNKQVEIKSFTMHDLLGRTYFMQPTSNGNNQWTVETMDLPNGFYVLTLNNDFRSVKKILINH